MATQNNGNNGTDFVKVLGLRKNATAQAVQEAYVTKVRELLDAFEEGMRQTGGQQGQDQGGNAQAGGNQGQNADDGDGRRNPPRAADGKVADGRRNNGGNNNNQQTEEGAQQRDARQQGGQGGQQGGQQDQGDFVQQLAQLLQKFVGQQGQQGGGQNGDEVYGESADQGDGRSKPGGNNPEGKNGTENDQQGRTNRQQQQQQPQLNGGEKRIYTESDWGGKDPTVDGNADRKATADRRNAVPKAEANAMLMGDFAKQIKINVREFRRRAAEDGYIYKDKQQSFKWAATQNALDAGLFAIDEKGDSRITEIGQEHFANEYGPTK